MCSLALLLIVTLVLVTAQLFVKVVILGIVWAPVVAPAKVIVEITP